MEYGNNPYGDTPDNGGDRSVLYGVLALVLVVLGIIAGIIYLT